MAQAGRSLGVPVESKLSLLRGLKRLEKAWCKERGAKVGFVQGKEKEGGNYVSSSMSLSKREQEVGKTARSSQVLCLVPFLEKKQGPEELSEKQQRLQTEHRCSMMPHAPRGSRRTGPAAKGITRWEQAAKLPCDPSHPSTSLLGAERSVGDDGAPDQLLCWLKLCASLATS